ncbi:uncharacterized protein BJ171DRAFT_591625 [Polychytrium aggregatum]|uniref:uncharacterized protein n=1 Tax=Polychytrium aggregatum TaxID=110093 RepID=UPI0022FDFC0E|nr:uncharacterized protein BJ171DRAFT_591625 [Polychytrium aggregatum]KAI9190630.1 hypothetical protein BJ171DRAFT_591625 [Polychytrium aggregatum]
MSFPVCRWLLLLPEIVQAHGVCPLLDPAYQGTDTLQRWLELSQYRDGFDRYVNQTHLRSIERDHKSLLTVFNQKMDSLLSETCQLSMEMIEDMVSKHKRGKHYRAKKDELIRTFGVVHEFTGLDVTTLLGVRSIIVPSSGIEPDAHMKEMLDALLDQQYRILQERNHVMSIQKGCEIELEKLEAGGFCLNQHQGRYFKRWTQLSLTQKLERISAFYQGVIPAPHTDRSCLDTADIKWNSKLGIIESIAIPETAPGETTPPPKKKRKTTKTRTAVVDAAAALTGTNTIVLGNNELAMQKKAEIRNVNEILLWCILQGLGIDKAAPKVEPEFRAYAQKVYTKMRNAIINRNIQDE